MYLERFTLPSTQEKERGLLMGHASENGGYVENPYYNKNGGSMMNTYHFTEATPLIEFLGGFIGCTLKCFHAWLQPQYGYRHMSDLPVIFEFADVFVAVEYPVFSDIRLSVGTKEEILADEDAAAIVELSRGRLSEGEESQEKMIDDIQVERFSEAFECNGATGEERPAGGDYFSTIRIHLKDGAVLCLCGAAAFLDGYTEFWYE